MSQIATRHSILDSIVRLFNRFLLSRLSRKIGNLAPAKIVTEVCTYQVAVSTVLGLENIKFQLAGKGTGMEPNDQGQLSTAMDISGFLVSRIEGVEE